MHVSMGRVNLVVFIDRLSVKKWPFIKRDIVANQKAMAEVEFFLLEILDCCLVVYHPYRPLKKLIKVGIHSAIAP